MENNFHTSRIAITGLGIICALGDSPEEVYRRMKNAESGIKRIRTFNTKSLHCSIAGELDEEQIHTILSDESTSSLDHCARYAIPSARQALTSSGLKLNSLHSNQLDNYRSTNSHIIPKNRIGLTLGTCNGGILSLEKQWQVDDLDTENTANYPFYQQGDDIAKTLGIHGPVTTINTACSASGNAIGYASDLIRWGYADVMLAGGSDPLSQSVFAGFNVLRALKKDPVSPFGQAYGLNLGEGSAFVVLERLDHALARNATIYGELCAYGLSNDAFHETAPHPEGSGLARAIRAAIVREQIPINKIHYVNAHGTGTEANDKAEVKALKQVFGDTLSIPVSSSKAYFGHNLGAAAAVELVSTLYAIHQGYLPGTLHFDQPRPGCEDVNIIGEKMRANSPEYILSNNAAFGGHNVSLLIRTGDDGRSLNKVLNDKALNENKRTVNESTLMVKETNCKSSDSDSHARVVITGIGAVGHFGILQGKILEAIKSVPKTGSNEMLGKARFSLKEYEKSKYERRMNALSQYTIGAAMEAMKQANLDASISPEVGFIYGTSRGSTESISRFLRSVFEKGPEYASSIYFPHTVINSIAGKAAHRLNLQGFNSSISTGGNEGLTTALYAKGLIETGVLSTCLIGSGDERSALSDSIDDAKGLTKSQFLQTEGSVCIVVNNLEHAISQQKEIIAELRGFSTRFTAGLVTEEKEKLIQDVINEAIKNSDLSFNMIDLILLNSVGRKGELEWEEKLIKQPAGDENVAPPIICLNDYFGYGESYSSMVHLAAAAELVSNRNSMKMIRQEGHPDHELDHVLVVSSSVNGSYTATVVSRT